MRKNTNGVSRLESSDNILWGYNAGKNLNPGSGVEGQKNIYIGDFAGDPASTTANNVGIGHRVMGKITTGSQNTAVGQAALDEATTSSSNSAFGQAALSATGIGSSNTGVGSRAGQYITGSNNTLIGALAGDNSTGNGNVLIGNHAGSTASGGNKLYIENSSSSSPLIYGEFDNDLVRINGTLDINNNYKLPTSSGSLGTIMVSGGSGNNAIWSNVILPVGNGVSDQILKRAGGTTLVWASDEVNDADSNPSNEIQTLSLNGQDLSISNGNMVTLPSTGSSVWSTLGQNTFYNTGDVGIGINIPDHRLSIVDENTITDGSDGVFVDIQNTEVGFGAMSGLRFRNGITDNTFKGGLYYHDRSGYGRGDLLFVNNDVNTNGNALAADARMIIPHDDHVSLRTNFSATNRLEIYPNTTSVTGNSGVFMASKSDGAVGYSIEADSSSFKLNLESIGTEVNRLRVDALGVWNFNQGAFILNPNVAGDSRFTTDELEIRGGSDLAETFDISAHAKLPEKGMLVSIDTDNPGKLKLSSIKNCPLLAGVISGANGIDHGLLMGQKGSIADGEYPITLTGRVYVKTCLEGGDIKPGDIIISSSRTGIAMRGDRSNVNVGGMLGKALTSRDSNGYVLTLVNVR